MTTATVETLTAEVRVLMVGNRQVTLSVYKQLDEYLSEPGWVNFGRVRSGTLYPHRYDCDRPWLKRMRVAHMEFVGSHNGELKRASLNKEEFGAVDIDVQRRLMALPLIVLAGLR